METSIGSIWTVRVRVPVHALDMVPLFQTVWLISRKGSSKLIRLRLKVILIAV